MPNRFGPSRRALQLALNRYEAEGRYTPDQFCALVWAWTSVPTAPVVWVEGREWRLLTHDVGIPPARLQVPLWHHLDVLCAYRSRWYQASGGRIVDWAQRIDDEFWRSVALNAAQRPVHYEATRDVAPPAPIVLAIEQATASTTMETRTSGALIRQFYGEEAGE